MRRGIPEVIWVPRGVPWRTLVALCEGVGWVCRRLGLALLVAGLPAVAWGAGLTIPQRLDRACLSLGYAPGCVLVYEPGRRIRATVVVMVADRLGEPDVTPVLPGVRASSLVVIVQRPAVTLATTYQRNEYGDLRALLTEPPCLSGECVERRVWVDGYTGPTEAVCADVASVEEKMQWQIPDREMQEALRRVVGATGMPIVTRVWNIAVDDETATGLATTATMQVEVRFALPPS